MTPSNAAATTCVVVARPRGATVQTSARTCAPLALAPKRARVYRGWAALLSAPPLIAGNGLADWSLEHAIRRHVAEVLRYTEGDQQWAAEALGVNPSTLYRWLREWGSQAKEPPAA